ncbi:glycoprotein 3-alpha-L-fucosyltransferase A-like protein [Tanacetum coccineum]
MTTSLSSNVFVGYFSWAEYDIMAPVQPKIEKILAAALISNCVASNFRLQALNGLEKVNIKIDSYGGLYVILSLFFLMSCMLLFDRALYKEFVDVTKPVELEKEVKDMESDVHAGNEKLCVSVGQSKLDAEVAEKNALWIILLLSLFLAFFSMFLSTMLDFKLSYSIIRNIFMSVAMIKSWKAWNSNSQHQASTMTMKAVANSTSATFLRVVSGELIQKYLGDGPKLVRELFKDADDLSPSIIFIDEIDTVDSEVRPVLSHGQLYVAVSKVKSRKYVVIKMIGDIDWLVKNLCTMRFGRMRLHANVVRFQRTPMNERDHPDGAKGVYKTRSKDTHKDLGQRMKTNSYPGKVYWIRAKETFGWVPEFMEEELAPNESDDEMLDEDLNIMDEELQKETKLDVYSNEEEVPESSFVHEQMHANDDEQGHNNIETEEVSKFKDPFRIYDILNKKVDNKEGEDNSNCSIPYPPGFTPLEDGEVELNKSDDKEGHVKVDKQKDSSIPDDYMQLPTQLDTNSKVETEAWDKLWDKIWKLVYKILKRSSRLKECQSLIDELYVLKCSRPCQKAKKELVKEL